MLGQRHGLTSAEETQLKALAQAWQGIAPANGFEADVWRRIRTQAAVQPSATLSLRLPAWLLLPAPVRLPALALAVLFLLAGGLLGTAV